MMLWLGLFGIGLMLFAFTQRPKGKPLKFSLWWGFTESLYVRGRVMFYTGLFLIVLATLLY